MHLIQSYALQTGAKISKPQLYSAYYPLKPKSYITLQAKGSCQAKQYDYWDSVSSILGPILARNGIQIVQIGKDDKSVLPKALSLVDKTNLYQSNYLIENSLLHLGNDSFAVHVASAFDIPIVALYSNSTPELSGPFWGDKSKHRLLKPKNQKNPSYAFEESVKSINSIKPEEIAKSVCDILGIDFDFPYRTIYVGSASKSKSIEIIPTVSVEIKGPKIESLVVRMDYHFNEKNLISQLRKYKCTIVTNKPIDIRIINSFKKNINEVYYILNEENDLKFAASLKQCAVKFVLATEFEGEKMNDLKLKYMDCGMIHPVVKNKFENIREFDGKDLNNLFYQSSKCLINGQSMYKSKTAMTNNDASEFNYNIFFDVSPLKINSETEKELQFFSVFELCDFSA